MLGIIKQRHAAEETELKPGAGGSNGMMPVDSLHSLMEQRKRMAPGEIDKPEIRKLLMDKYKVDDHTLTLLLKNYNTMAVMPVSLDDKSERRLGIWVNDKMDWEKNVTAVDDRNIAIKKARQAAIKDNAKAQKDDKERDEKRLNDLFDESY
jgi:hypothetical protein